MSVTIKQSYPIAMKKAFKSVRTIGGITTMDSSRTAPIRKLMHEILSSPKIQDLCHFFFPALRNFPKKNEKDLVSRWTPIIKPLIKRPEYRGNLITLRGFWDGRFTRRLQSIPTEKPGFYVYYTRITRGKGNAKPSSYCQLYIVFDTKKSANENVRLILGNQHTCYVV